MRIFVSSTFEDLREHRAAAIRVLRQLGHEVLAMEDLVALSAAPLTKVLEMVDRSEAYVGIFAWRYGYVPGPGTSPAPPVQPPDVAGATIPTPVNAGRRGHGNRLYLPSCQAASPNFIPWRFHPPFGIEIARNLMHRRH